MNKILICAAGVNITQKLSQEGRCYSLIPLMPTNFLWKFENSQGSKIVDRDTENCRISNTHKNCNLEINSSLIQLRVEAKRAVKNWDHTKRAGVRRRRSELTGCTFFSSSSGMIPLFNIGLIQLFISSA